MSQYRKFDPYEDVQPCAPAKVAKVAKDDPGRTITLAALATLAAPPAENVSSDIRSITAVRGRSDERRQPVALARTLLESPTEWAALLHGFTERPCPITIEPKRWLQLQEDARRLVDQWGGQAAALGWSTSDMFGCHPTHPTERYDAMGLVWMVADAEIVAMGAEVVNLRKASGTLQRVWKCPIAHGRILAWNL